MIFVPQTEEEIQRSSFLPDGIYEYEVFDAKDEISKSTGKEYISLILHVFDEDGKQHKIFTNLSWIKLIKHFCDVNNLQDAYKSGCINASMLIGKSSGRAMIGFEGEKVNPNGGMYKAKNIVKDYIVAPQRSLLTPLTPKDDFLNDAIPF